MDYLEKYNQWLTSDYIDAETKTQLEAIRGDEAAIKESFYSDLEFGTGGMRGIIGPGTNRINIYTIRKATQGIANYILKVAPGAKERGVAIAYDSRHCSPTFARETALVLNANGIKTYMFENLAPTPLLSFAVRELGTIAGVVITASHNPPQYNGYKLYWEDGGQVVPDVAEVIIEQVEKITDFYQIHTISREDAEAAGLFQIIGAEVEKKFIEKIVALSLIDASFADTVRDLGIVYTPLHGTGNFPVRMTLKELGFQNVQVVPEQELPDPDFSTVGYPNPEDKKAFTLAIQQAKEIDADLIIGTDPDCDRIGVVEQTESGEYQVLTGNQTGVLLTNYILSRKKEQGSLPENGAVIKTIVTTDMVREIANDYQIPVFDTLTGFKFIGEKIKEFIEKDSYTFLLGFEESYGYLTGTYARDKDAVAAAAMICEMAAYYKSQGVSLYQQLQRLWERYGYYLEDLVSIKLEGLAGQEKIAQMMTSLREKRPELIGKRQVVTLEDYLVQKKYQLDQGEVEPLDLPKSNVLKFTFDDKSSFTVRPSGTEPKIKLYFSVAGKSLEESRRILKEVKDDVLALMES